MSVEDKFRAAVNVIRSLPKNGSYQPSHELMLRFYAYFKLAGVGRPVYRGEACVLGGGEEDEMGRMEQTGQHAPRRGHEQLRRGAQEGGQDWILWFKVINIWALIVETMSYTENVADFLGSLGSFYNSVPMEDLELLVGNVIERVRSQPGSPLNGSPLCSREASPHRLFPDSKHITSSLETSPASSYSASPLPPDDDEEEEEFIDTVETEPEHARKDNTVKAIPKKVIHHNHMNGNPPIPKDDPSGVILNGHTMNGHHNHDSEDGTPMVNGRSRPRERGSPNMPRPASNCVLDHIAASADADNTHKTTKPTSTDVSEKIRETVLHLQKDLDRITTRVRSLEVASLSSVANWPAQSRSSQRKPSWWPFPELSPQTVAFLVAWPFVAHAFLIWVQRRRLRNRLHP
uniref:Acyl-CoA-binding domain-containing protein 5 n=1 Tax=Timema bartmani TaxID=61472 RepID=A0A7R9EV69_9NEOP|nr:unnamed protein product [Timema bartmani]